MRSASALGFLALAAFLVSCALGPGSGSRADAPTSVEPEISTGPVAGVPQALLDAVVADAARRADVPIGEVKVVTAEAVTWSDGSLGCPEPGMFYTQALVPGFRVVVEAGGRELSFHAAESGDFRFCENPRPPLDDANQ